MANEVCTSLGLVGKDLTGKLLQIVETHGSSASFMIGSLMWNVSRLNTSVCLVALHHSSNHYQNVSKRLGFNLKTAIENKTAVILEPFYKYVNKIGCFGNIDMSKEDNLKRILFDIKEAMNSCSGKKCLIIDDLSDLMCLGSSISMAMEFFQSCRALQENDKDIIVIVCSHLSEDNFDETLLSNFIAHAANYRMTIAGLTTGFSTTVTGSIEVVDNLDHNYATVVDKKLFHYKLTDRQVKVFAPGTVGIQV